MRAVISDSTAFSRSSNSPRNFAPAINAPISSAIRRLSRNDFRHVAIDDAQRQAFRDRGLADARLADQNRIVLGAARQDLDRATDFLVAADDRVELALTRDLGQIARIFLQCVVSIFRGRAVRRAALAQIVDRGIQSLRRHARTFHGARRWRACAHRDRLKQALRGHERIARLLGQVLSEIEVLAVSGAR